VGVMEWRRHCPAGITWRVARTCYVLIPRTEVFAGLKWLHSCLCEPVIGGERADNIHQPEDGEGQTGEGASLIKIGDVFVLISFRLSDVISDYFACFFS
jgi:hypothetical protein